MAVNLIVSATVQTKENFTIDNPIINLNEFAINSEGYEDTSTTGVKLGDGQTRWSELPYLQNITHDMVNTWLRFQTETTNSRLVTLPDMQVIYANAVAVSDEELDTAIRQTETINNLLTVGEQQNSKINAIQSNLTKHEEAQETINDDFTSQIKKQQEILNENIAKIALKVDQSVFDGFAATVNQLKTNKYDQSAGDALKDRLDAAENDIQNLEKQSLDLSQIILTGGNSTTE